MRITYIDDYEEELLETDSSYIPQVGNSVYIGNTDEWIVQKIIWNADSDISVVILKHIDDIVLKKDKKVDDSGRLHDLGNAIVETNKRLDVSDKKARLARDQVTLLRSHIKRNTPKPKDINGNN